MKNYSQDHDNFERIPKRKKSFGQKQKAKDADKARRRSRQRKLNSQLRKNG